MTDGFVGSGYVAELDEERLQTSLDHVREYMLSHGGWRSVSEIVAAIEPHCAVDGSATVTRHLRYLRAKRFGGYIVECERSEENKGTWLYRVTEPPEGYVAPDRVAKGRTKKTDKEWADRAIDFADEAEPNTPLYDWLVELAYYLDPS